MIIKTIFWSLLALMFVNCSGTDLRIPKGTPSRSLSSEEDDKTGKDRIATQNRMRAISHISER